MRDSKKLPGCFEPEARIKISLRGGLSQKLYFHRKIIVQEDEKNSGRKTLLLFKNCKFIGVTVTILVTGCSKREIWNNRIHGYILGLRGLSLLSISSFQNKFPGSHSPSIAQFHPYMFSNLGIQRDSARIGKSVMVEIPGHPVHESHANSSLTLISEHSCNNNTRSFDRLSILFDSVAPFEVDVTCDPDPSEGRLLWQRLSWNI
jgi:hypothetical protein